VIGCRGQRCPDTRRGGGGLKCRPHHAASAARTSRPSRRRPDSAHRSPRPSRHRPDHHGLKPPSPGPSPCHPTAARPSPSCHAAVPALVSRALFPRPSPVHRWAPPLGCRFGPVALGLDFIFSEYIQFLANSKNLYRIH
jgi:hypothetical protein